MAIDVLVVDDEGDIRGMVSGLLEDEGYSVAVAANVDAALKRVAEDKPSVIVLDVWLEGSRLDGIQLLPEIRALLPEAVILMMSGHADIETAVKAIQDGAYDFIEKPFAADRIIISVKRAAEAAALRRENAALRERSLADWSLVGASPVIQALKSQIQRLAEVNSRVLIVGPSGAGKEVIARSIHAASPRGKGPFVAVNCAGIRPDTMEAALFGEHLPSGDIADGLLLSADGGVLLLDEVADMPLQTQAKMLRVIQEQTFTPVGGAAPQSVDIRVMASTSRDLKALAREGAFREDLYFRLNVVPIAAPPLTSRLEDVPVLVDYFMTRAALAGQPPRRLSESAVAALQAHSWPGNVRQLRNVVEWLLIMAPGGVDDEIGVEALPADILRDDPGALLAERREEIINLPLKEARELFERNYLTLQIARAGGNVSKTAKAVGMERSALHRKLRVLNIGDGNEEES